MGMDTPCCPVEDCHSPCEAGVSMSWEMSPRQTTHPKLLLILAIYQCHLTLNVV